MSLTIKEIESLKKFSTKKTPGLDNFSVLPNKEQLILSLI